MAAYRRVYDSRHLQLTAKNRDQLRNPTLGNRVWATFTLFTQEWTLSLTDWPASSIGRRPSQALSLCSTVDTKRPSLSIDVPWRKF